MLRVQRLKGIRLLEGLTKEARDIVLRSCSTVEYPKASTIFETGDHADIVYLILSGKVKLFIVTEDGNEVILSILGPEELFGLSAICGKDCRFVSASALYRTLLLCIPKRAFERAIRKDAGFAMDMIRTAGLRLIWLRNAILDLATARVETRLAKALLQLANKSDIPEHTDIRLSHEELGNFVHASRQKITATLNIFEEQGLINKRRRHITILDERGLENVAESALVEAPPDEH